MGKADRMSADNFDAAHWMNEEPEPWPEASPQVDLATVLVSLSTLTLNPGETLVVRCQQRISMEGIERIRGALQPYFPNNALLILDSGLTLEKISLGGYGGEHDE